jgi:uncharacterized protein (TIGR02246 family)
VIALAAAALLAAGCATHRSASAPPPAGAAATEIRAMLEASARSWNEGDLEAFLDDYQDAPTTAFVGSTVTHGVAEIRRRYLESYWRTGKPAQHLRFESIDVRPLGGDYALALGRYVLLTPGTTTTEGTGWFSLVLARTADGWKIIHDHSSEAKQ